MKLMEIMKKHKRTILLSALAVMSAISIMSVGPTYAYLKLEAPSHPENSFTAAASVAPNVNDDYSVSVGCLCPCRHRRDVERQRRGNSCDCSR